MELTYRQKVFMGKIIDLYHEMKEPVHYSVAAKRLGVSNSTAYDMLRLLEKKGLLSSQYDTPKETSGPGRASIKFIPTKYATELFSYLAGEDHEQKEWEDVKATILTSLRKGKAVEHQALLNELISRMPEARTPLVRCTEVMTALLLSFREARQELKSQKSVGLLLKQPVNKLSMSTTAGFILGQSLASRKLKQVKGDYQEYIKKYQDSLDKLSSKSLAALHKFTREAWSILKRTPQR
jgi:hypothetical protein